MNFMFPLQHSVQQKLAFSRSGSMKKLELCELFPDYAPKSIEYAVRMTYPEVQIADG